MSINLLILLHACFNDQSSRYHFDMIDMPVAAETFAYSVIITVLRTTCTVILSAIMLSAVTNFAQTDCQHDKESAPN
jgi:hypothetical protein